MGNNLQKKGNGFALLPFVVFIAIYLGAGLFLQAQGTEMAFYQFPSVTAMFIAVLFAFCMGKESLDQKFSIFAKGAANENVLTMLMIYILAGTGTMLTPDGTEILTAGSCHYCPKGGTHSLCNVNDADLVFLAIVPVHGA